MKRLLQISLDTLLSSFMPIITWILLGFILGKEISNVFSLTYPLQFVYLLFVSIFGIGPNITEKKLQKENVVASNLLLGTIVVGIFTLFLVFYIDHYISFMSMDPTIYHNYGIYSVFSIYFNFIIQIFSQKLYYENKNNSANKMNIIYHICSFFTIVIFSLIYQNQWISILISLVIQFLMICYVFSYYFRFTKANICFVQNVKYTSFGILSNISMFLIYAVGFGNSFSYGEKYLTAINFEALTTDAQWDALSSVDTASRIDFAKDQFDYKKSLKNSYQLLGLLIGSTLLMNFILYTYYTPDVGILLIILSIQIFDMFIHPLKALRMSYLQINMNSKKINVYYLISKLGRFLCSFIPSAFCTYIGQMFSGLYLLIFSFIKCRKVKAFQKER